MLARNTAHNTIKGVRICRSAPSISHLFSPMTQLLLAFWPDMKELLDSALICTNRSCFFSPNTQRDQIHELLGAKVVNTLSKCLGLPAVIGRSKAAAFAPLKERVWKKIKGWKEKL
ncbi:hypothetical protein RND81_13G179500 [Saponaria officinalis]|uniref:Uncharacterized protein n=1 Tax=Saponaria officinalis TaxID=3572 RepID=A0AAW1GZ27_SAPOF